MHRILIPILCSLFIFSCKKDKTNLALDLPKYANQEFSIFNWKDLWSNEEILIGLDQNGKGKWDDLKEDGYYLLFNNNAQDQLALVYLSKGNKVEISSKNGVEELSFNDPDNRFINSFRKKVRSFFLETQEFQNYSNEEFLLYTKKLKSKILKLHKKEAQEASNLVSEMEKQNALYSLEYLKLNYIENKNPTDLELDKYFEFFDLKISKTDEQLFSMSDAYRDFLTKYYYLLSVTKQKDKNQSIAKAFLENNFKLPSETKDYIFFEILTGRDGEKSLGNKEFLKNEILANKEFFRSSLESQKFKTYFDLFIQDFSELTVEKKANEIIAKSIKNEKFDWKNYQGKPVLLDIWASWCRPCIQQIPALEELKNKYKGKIHIVGISIDDDKERWEKALIKYNLNSNQFLVDQEFASDFSSNYKISTIPHYILVDANGMTINDNIRYIQNLANKDFHPDLIRKLDELTQ